MKFSFKKFLVISIAALALTGALFGLTACGGNKAEDTKAPAQEQKAEDKKADNKKAEEKKDEASKLSGEVHLQAAASLKYSFEELIPMFNKKYPDVKVTPNFDASGTLAEQIKQGAPADIFISANKAKMDDVEKDGKVLDGTRKDFLENELVLIVPADSKLDIKGLEDLTKDDVKRVAVGEPKAVPAGKYAAQSIESAGLTDKLAGKLVQGKDVTQVLTYVMNNEADAGMVYKTDALTQPEKVKIVSVVEGHDKVIYPAAMLKDSKSPEASKAFFDFIGTDEAAKVFEKYGFKLVK